MATRRIRRRIETRSHEKFALRVPSGQVDWGAHAFSVLVAAFCGDELSSSVRIQGELPRS
jgi:hypothetical protein